MLDSHSPLQIHVKTQPDLLKRPGFEVRGEPQIRALRHICPVWKISSHVHLPAPFDVRPGRTPLRVVTEESEGMRPDSQIKGSDGKRGGEAPRPRLPVKNLHLVNTVYLTLREKPRKVETTSKTVGCDKTPLWSVWRGSKETDVNQTGKPRSETFLLSANKDSSVFSFLWQPDLHSSQSLQPTCPIWSNSIKTQSNVQLKFGIKGQSVCPEGQQQKRQSL